MDASGLAIFSWFRAIECVIHRNASAEGVVKVMEFTMMNETGAGACQLTGGVGTHPRLVLITRVGS